jgi:hypothetical protein
MDMHCTDRATSAQRDQKQNGIGSGCHCSQCDVKSGEHRQNESKVFGKIPERRKEDTSDAIA